MNRNVRLWLIAINVAAIVAGIWLGRWVFYTVST